MVKNHIFINCPFDEQYRELLRPLLFTLIYLGFNPRIASEYLNSAANRIDKICELINTSNFSIHDLSRCTASKKNDFFRMNMPFEFGIDFGNYYFYNHEKKMLVLESKLYDYQKAISDLSGVDTKCHNNEPKDLVRCIRNWMIEADILKVADSPTRIWYRFTDFTSDFYDDRIVAGFSEKDLNDMPTPEYIIKIKKWLISNMGKD
jgi:hypothetical protein